MKNAYTMIAYINDLGIMSFPEPFPEDLPGHEYLNDMLEEFEHRNEDFSKWERGYYDVKLDIRYEDDLFRVVGITANPYWGSK